MKLRVDAVKPGDTILSCLVVQTATPCERFVTHESVATPIVRFNAVARDFPTHVDLPADLEIDVHRPFRVGDVVVVPLTTFEDWFGTKSTYAEVVDVGPGGTLRVVELEGGREGRVRLRDVRHVQEGL